MEPTTMTARQPRPDPTIDRLLDALSDARRRRAFAVVADQSPPIDLKAIAGEIAASAEQAVTESAVETVALELHHLHLPKLEDAGLVEYDAERGIAEASHDRSRIEPALELLDWFSTGR